MPKIVTTTFLLLLIIAGVFFGKSLFQTKLNEPLSNTDNPENKKLNPTMLLSVTDYAGNVISFDKPVKRIVALAPHIVENVYSAGAGDLLVAVTDYSNFPESAKSLPIVAGYNFINYEAITVLKPDLIIAWETGHKKSSLKRLTELGFKVYIDHPKKLKDVAKSIRDIGVLSERQATANQASNTFLSTLNNLKTRYAQESKVSLFYQIWDQPLQTINGKHIISDALSVCGGMNIYADELAFVPTINIESIIERNPQAIIGSGKGNVEPKWLSDWRKWPELRAVKQENLLFVNPDLINRHTARILLGIENICEQLVRVRNKPQVIN